jgi:hypothetical protein
VCLTNSIDNNTKRIFANKEQAYLFSGQPSGVKLPKDTHLKGQNRYKSYNIPHSKTTHTTRHLYDKGSQEQRNQVE